jgi:hypothetical protein
MTQDELIARLLLAGWTHYRAANEEARAKYAVWLNAPGEEDTRRMRLVTCGRRYGMDSRTGPERWPLGPYKWEFVADSADEAYAWLVEHDAFAGPAKEAS